MLAEQLVQPEPRAARFLKSTLVGRGPVNLVVSMGSISARRRIAFIALLADRGDRVWLLDAVLGFVELPCRPGITLSQRSKQAGIERCLIRFHSAVHFDLRQCSLNSAQTVGSA